MSKRKNKHYEDILEQGKNLIGFYLDNPCIAAYDLLGVDMAPIQRLVFNDMWFKDYVIAVCSRGFGKSQYIGSLSYFKGKGLVYLNEELPPIPFYLRNGEEEVINWDADILTSEGYKPIKKLCLEKGIKGVYIRTHCGFENRGSPHHPILTLDANCKLSYKKLSALTAGDRVCIQREQLTFGTGVMDYEEAYLLGLFMGNEDINDANNIDVKVESEYATDIFKYCDDAKFEYKKSYDETTAIYNLYLKNVDPILQKYNIEQTFYYEKAVPYFIRTSTRESQIAFLQGYFDSTSAFYNNGCGIFCKSSSKKLLQEIQLMLLNFGVLSRLKHRQIKGKNKEQYRDHYLLNMFYKDVNKFKDIMNFKQGSRIYTVVGCLKDPKFNVHTDTIPNVKKLMRRMQIDYLTINPLISPTLGRRPELKATLWNDQDCSYYYLDKFIKRVDYLLRSSWRFSPQSSKDLATLKNVYCYNFFYDTVEYTSPWEGDCYDFEMNMANSKDNDEVIEASDSIKYLTANITAESSYSINNLNATVFGDLGSYDINDPDDPYQLPKDPCGNTDGIEPNYFTNGFINHNTFSIGTLSALSCMLKPGYRVGLISSSFRQSKMIFAEVEKLYAQSSIFREACEKPPTRGTDSCYLKFKSVSGVSPSYIEALPIGNDGGKIRGSRFYLIVIDELAQIPDSIIDLIVRPMGATSLAPMERVRRLEQQEKLIKLGLATMDDFEKETVNKMIMTSSGYYKFNHMWRRMQDHWRQVDDVKLTNQVSPYAVWQIPYWDLPSGFLDMNNINEAKRVMSSSEFKMEYEAAMISDSEGFFKASLLEQCTLSSGFFIEPRGDKNGQYVMGVDPNQGGSASAGIVIIRTGAVNRVVNVLELKKQTTQETTETIQDICNNYNINRIFMDKGGGGKAICDLLEAGHNNYDNIIDRTNEEHKHLPGRHILEMVTFNPAWISDANFTTKAMLENKNLLFPELPVSTTVDLESKLYDTVKVLKSQMLNIVVTQTPSGSLHFDTPTKSQNKDLYSALILAAHGARSIEKELEGEQESILHNSSGMIRLRNSSQNYFREVQPIGGRNIATSAAVLKKKIK